MSDGKRPPDDKLGGLFHGINELADQLGRQIGDLAKNAQELRRGGEFKNLGAVVRGVYDLTVKNLGGDPFHVTAEPPGRAAAPDFIEPAADVFEEADHFLVLTELPGVGPEDVKLDLNGVELAITAERGVKKYRKAVRLPAAPRRDGVSHTCRNGVLEVNLLR
jgi:HSP20 family protein